MLSLYMIYYSFTNISTLFNNYIDLEGGDLFNVIIQYCFSYFGFVFIILFFHLFEASLVLNHCQKLLINNKQQRKKERGIVTNLNHFCSLFHCLSHFYICYFGVFIRLRNWSVKNKGPSVNATH